MLLRVKQLVKRGTADNLQVSEALARTRINLITYLCAKNADISRYRETRKRPKKKQTAPKGNCQQWDVGYRVGPSIEKELQKPSSGSPIGSGTPKRPHVRSAHWHHYWVGGGESKKIVVRWVSEIFVNCGDAENLPITERRNKKYIH